MIYLFAYDREHIYGFTDFCKRLFHRESEVLQMVLYTKRKPEEAASKFSHLAFVKNLIRDEININ